MFVQQHLCVREKESESVCVCVCVRVCVRVTDRGLDRRRFSRCKLLQHVLERVTSVLHTHIQLRQYSTHTHTHTHTYTHTRTHTHIHSHTHKGHTTHDTQHTTTNVLAHACTLSHAHMHTCAHIRTHTCTLVKNARQGEHHPLLSTGCQPGRQKAVRKSNLLKKDRFFESTGTLRRSLSVVARSGSESGLAQNQFHWLMALQIRGQNQFRLQDLYHLILIGFC